MKLLYIIGNRPQFIKLAVLHQEIKKHPFIQERAVHTGQHFSPEMSDVFFKDLNIDLPISHLHIHSLSHVTLIGRTMEALEPEIAAYQPDYIVVFGDTNATLAGALAGKKIGIPVAHVEAGIRTFEEAMPEESNRYLTDRIAAINFCCTPSGVEHLKREGFCTGAIASDVVYSGDIMLDAYRQYYPQFVQRTGILNELRVERNNYVLFTLHRKDNIENRNRLQQITEALSLINKEWPVVCPLHPNTQQFLMRSNIAIDFITILPVGYFDMQHLLHHCTYVITDSGGLQREAFFAHKPTLILMEKPFWPEVVEYGNALHCKSEKEVILQTFKALKNLEKQPDTSLFGDGYAAEKIVHYLIHHHKSSLPG